MLPLHPFALLLASAVWERVGRKRGMAILMLRAALIAAEWIALLSYFNVLVRPAESYRLLTDRNLDGGQSLLPLRESQRSHPQEQILSCSGRVDAALPLGENERVSGTVMRANQSLRSGLGRTTKLPLAAATGADQDPRPLPPRFQAAGQIVSAVDWILRAAPPHGIASRRCTQDP